MAFSAGFAEFIVDLFAPLGGVRIKRMFGGAGVYAGEIMFGLIADDVLYLKVCDEDREIFRKSGAKPFAYRGKDGRTMTLSYYTLPEELYDDPEESVRWGRRALRCAQHAATRKAPQRASLKAGRRRGTF